ncbi:MAG: acyl-CoA thioesterase domain-containing protein [Tepidiformaceae bacterium]
MSEEAFARSEGEGRYTLHAIARGPWDADSLHARVLAALLAHELELRWTEGGFHCARLTIDLYRLPTLAPAEITTRAVREGNRIRVIELEYLSGGVSFARANAVLLKRTDNPPGDRWSPPNWQAPAPETLTEGGFGPNAAENWRPMWETRHITGWPAEIRQHRAWLRETRPLIEEVALTPFVRAASAADWTNPFANWSSEGLQFINADITLYLHRYPEGEWIGFEVTSHHSADGIAVGDCTMYDADGPIGHSLVCAVSNARRTITPPER